LPQRGDVVVIDLAGCQRDLFEQGQCGAQTVVDLSFAPIGKDFAC